LDTLIHRRVKAAQKGENQTVICKVNSGWVVLADMQILRGYSILLPDPVVSSINDLSKTKRIEFLYEMTVVGDALLKVTDAFRINYEILCNTDPALHVHIFPRYKEEPEEIRKSFAWEYYQRGINQIPFDYERDKGLMLALKEEIENRIT
jgi:diadenosine tetraphosphate (Ap4A) HIT family hydrolase